MTPEGHRTEGREPYTREEAARLLRVSEWTVGAMTRDGRLIRVPGLRAVRIVRASLDALLEGQTAIISEPGLAAPEPISYGEPPQLDPVVVRRIREV